MEWRCPKCGKIDKRFGFHKCSSVSSSEVDSIFSEIEDFEKQEKIQDKKQDNNVVPVAQCPYCEEKIPQNSVKCPYCAEDIKNYQKTEADKNTAMPAQDVIDSLKAAPVPTEQKDAKSTTINQSVNNHKKDLKNKLSKLEELFKDGILSEEEYRTKKEQMIDDFLSK